jgi:hypothetical protein
VDGLGIATAWDDTNRFSIASDALFSRCGASNVYRAKWRDTAKPFVPVFSDYTG